MAKDRIEVTWIDSHTQYGWQSNDNALDATEEIELACTTVGYKFRETKTTLWLVMSKAPASVHTLHAIPKVAITKVRKLK